MNQLERNQAILRKYIPGQAVGIIAEWIVAYNFKLKIKRSRSSKEGDYTAPHNGRNHLITVNHDLNQYAFLITLIHEIAHLVTWEKYKGKVNPHGSEWKAEYSKLIHLFLQKDSAAPQPEKIFPHEISLALKRHMIRPSAASCSDIHLSRMLKKFDADDGAHLLEKIAAGSAFRISGSRSRHAAEVFIKGEKRRTRFQCFHARTKREYLIHALCRVTLI